MAETAALVLDVGGTKLVCGVLDAGGRVLADALQTTFEDAVPLSEVEFVVVDLETTGGSPADSRITEIGAVKLRGGERTGVFETLVNPGVPVPRQITHLTGIDDLVVAGAPPIEWVLPSFAEFARGCIFVAHNARFDFTFLNVALERLGLRHEVGHLDIRTWIEMAPAAAALP